MLFTQAVLFHVIHVMAPTASCLYKIHLCCAMYTGFERCPLTKFCPTCFPYTSGVDAGANVSMLRSGVLDFASTDRWAVLLFTALIVKQTVSIMEWLRRTVSSDPSTDAARPSTRSKSSKTSFEKLIGYHDLAKAISACHMYHVVRSDVEALHFQQALAPWPY